MLAQVLEVVQGLVARWQAALGDDVQVVLGGSLVSGLFIVEGAETVDVDARFLTAIPVDDPALIARVEAATGLKFRKTITVADWPEGQSVGVMVEGLINLPGIHLPLEVEGCIRNPKYVGWARFYTAVLTVEELAVVRAQKVALRGDKKAYKAYKETVRAEVQRRVLERGLLG